MEFMTRMRGRRRERQLDAWLESRRYCFLQNDFDIANQAGASFRSDINSALQSLATNSSGATGPATTYAYQWWADTTTGLLKIRNAANSAWFTVGTLASVNLGLAAAGVIGSSGLTMSTARLLGRTTASTGAIEEISVGEGLSLLGGSLTAASAGTFTPAITFATPGNLSVSYGTQTGSYYKIGKLVFVKANIITSAFTHTTASGNLSVTGFPFALEVDATNLSRIDLQGWQGITSANFTQMSLRLESGATTATAIKNGSGQNTSTITAVDMPTGGTVALQFSGCYLAGA